MRLAVIGSKEFHDYSRLKYVLDKIDDITRIVSGAAAGTDKMAARYARERNIKLIEFPPDYEQYKDEAKQIRDRQIVDNCDRLIAFWDGKCAGTKYTLDYAKKQNIPIDLIPVLHEGNND